LLLIAKAAGRLPSAEAAAFALELADIDVSARHVQRIALEIGAELVRKRDEKVIQQRRRELPVGVAAAPEAVAVEVDGGRVRTRAVGKGPGVHEQQNKEDKVAALVTLSIQEYPTDPRPEPPESFLEPRRARRLVRQMQGQAGDRPQEEEKQEDASTAGQPEGSSAAQGDEDRTSPQKRVRTCLASRAASREFGPMMAAEAQERGFYRARKRAFLGDGAAYNWTIHRGYFPDFEPIADFLHVLCYVYLAAWAVGPDEQARWSIYVGWLRACWGGRVREVIEELRTWQGRVGEPPEAEELDEKDPRRLVAEALSYLQNNQSRMDYPRYRKEGLPITSSLVESLVGQFNARVKSKQKYFNRPGGAEAILQLRAAVLSEDVRLERFFAQRTGNPHRRRKAG
jgi:hypothetical protein